MLNTSLKWLHSEQLLLQIKGTYIRARAEAENLWGNKSLCPNTSIFFLNSMALWALPTQAIHAASGPPHTLLPVGACWAFPDIASGYNWGREFQSSLGSSVLQLQRHSWIISQKMKTTYAMAYKRASSLWGKNMRSRMLSGTALWGAAVGSGPWHSVPTQRNQRPFRQKKGRYRRAVGYLRWESGPLAQRHLYLGTPGPCCLDHQGSKVLKMIDHWAISLPKRNICGH